jgi:hypothetical protein
MGDPVAAIAIDGGTLPLGGGLLALVRPALDACSRAAPLDPVARPGLRQTRRRGCAERHEYPARAGRANGTIARGALGAVAFVASPIPDADPASGPLRRAVRARLGAPATHLRSTTATRRALEVGRLCEQAAGAQWDATRDAVGPGRPPPALDAALGQIMTFLAENELSALYLPSRHRAHPPCYRRRRVPARSSPTRRAHRGLPRRPVPRRAGNPRRPRPVAPVAANRRFHRGGRSCRCSGRDLPRSPGSREARRTKAACRAGPARVRRVASRPFRPAHVRTD